MAARLLAHTGLGGPLLLDHRCRGPLAGTALTLDRHSELRRDEQPARARQWRLDRVQSDPFGSSRSRQSLSWPGYALRWARPAETPTSKPCGGVAWNSRRVADTIHLAGH